MLDTYSSKIQLSHFGANFFSQLIGVMYHVAEVFRFVVYDIDTWKNFADLLKFRFDVAMSRKNEVQLFIHSHLKKL